jgi:flagellar motor switch protein FliM
MEKLLDQEQINAMIRARRGQATAAQPVKPAHATVTDCDLRHPTHLTNEQVRAVTSLHEAVARNLSQSMSAYLRVGFEAAVVSVEQLTYSEFLGRLPDLTYLCALHVEPLAAAAVLQFDLQLGFPLIDLLLGGSGAAVNEVREATEIEEELLAGVVKLIARDLGTGWSGAGFDIRFEERQLPAAAQRLMRPSERTLVVSFELAIPQVRGTLNVAFPAVAAGALLRKLQRDAAPRSKTQAAPEAMIRNLLLDCDFSVRLELPKAAVSMRELVDMQVGSILTLDHAIGENIVVSANNVELFQARPVRTERHRGAQLFARLPGRRMIAAKGKDSHVL